MPNNSRDKILLKKITKNNDDDDFADDLCKKEIRLRKLVKVVNCHENKNIVSNAYDEIEKTFEKFLHSKATKYFVKGGDSEDIIQEGRIGLHKAIKDFDEKRGMSFTSFACMCIERHLVSTIKRGLRNKTEILNESQSLDQRVFVDDDGDNDEATLKDIVYDELYSGPEECVLSKDRYYTLKSILSNKLTAMERCVLDEYLRGHSYRTIAKNLDINTKSVDNAMSRVKAKAQELGVNDLDGLLD